MKKLLSTLLLSSVIGFGSCAFAGDVSAIKDIPEDYWAKKSIECAIINDIMAVDEEGNFNPEGNITRIEFVQALLKLLSNDNLDVNVQNSFTDIQETDEFFADILRSEQLGLVYGYPDKTFQGNNPMLRCETASVISHITKDKFVDCSILDPYSDKADIAEWAKIPYAKSISYSIYVNHPDENKLEPNRNLTRAEAAVLLASLRDKLIVVKPKYVGPKEITLSREHLSQYKRAPEDLVRVTNYRKVVYMENVLTPTYQTRFESKKQAVGDVVELVFNEDVYTDEGTLVFPAQSKIVSEVSNIENPQSWNKHAKVYLDYKQLVLPDGTAYDLSAQTFAKNNALTETWWQRYGKAATIVGLCTPGLNYRTKSGEKVRIQLSDILAIRYAQPQEVQEAAPVEENVQQEVQEETQQDVQEDVATPEQQQTEQVEEE